MQCVPVMNIATVVGHSYFTKSDQIMFNSLHTYKQVVDWIGLSEVQDIASLTAAAVWQSTTLADSLCIRQYNGLEYQNWLNTVVEFY